MKNLSVLLIGGTGCLSTAVTAESLRQGVKVAMVNRGRHSIPAGVELVKSDKDDFETIGAQIKGRHFDVVCDFLVYNTKELESSYRFYAPYCSQYIFISSCAVINGENTTGILDEDAPKVMPGWSYSVEKWDCERLLMRLSSEIGTPVTIVRPNVTYGDTRIPYGISPAYGYHWTLAARVLEGKPIITWNKGQNSSHMTRVEDFAVGFVGLFGEARAYGEAYNILGDATYTFAEVLDVLGECLRKKVKTVDLSPEFYAAQIPGRAGELLCGRCNNYVYSSEKIKKIVPGFKQTYTLKEGVAKTLEAYKNLNYQYGIDWYFEGQTDRAIANWCKHKGVSTSGMKLHFVDYLGTSSIDDRATYLRQRYADNRIIIKVISFSLRVLSFVKRKAKVMKELIINGHLDTTNAKQMLNGGGQPLKTINVRYCLYAANLKAA